MMPALKREAGDFQGRRRPTWWSTARVPQATAKLTPASASAWVRPVRSVPNGLTADHVQEGGCRVLDLQDRSDSVSRSPIANSIYNLYSHSVYFVRSLYSATQRGVKPRLILTTFGPALVIAAVSLTLFPVPVGVAVEGLIPAVLGARVAE